MMARTNQGMKGAPLVALRAVQQALAGRAVAVRLRVPEILTAILPEILAGPNRRTRSERHGENR